MAYNEEKFTKLKALKQLAERIKQDYATEASVTALSEKVDGLTIPTKTSELTNDIKFQTEEQVAAAVAAADHLQRKKVESVDAIDPAAEGADKYIYMVPKTGSDEDDLYDEYMVLDGSVEHVGNTKVDLSGYVQKTDIATDAEVTEMLAEIFGAAE